MRMRSNHGFLDFLTAVGLTLAALIAQFQEASAAKPAGAACADRIVSIGGDITEILYVLGANECIVAIDTTSQFPPQALKEKRNVGYLRALSAEGVLSTGGTLILASEGAGPVETVRALKASSVRFVAVPDNSSPEGISAKINTVAGAIGKTDAGKRLASDVAAAFAKLARRRNQLPRRAKVLFVLATNGSRIIVGGRETSADAILGLAGASNSAASIQGFKPITIEALVSMAPEAIIVMQRAVGAHSAGALLKLGAVQQTSAGRNNRIFEMSGTYLLGFGPRTPAAAKDLMGRLYPQVRD